MGNCPGGVGFYSERRPDHVQKGLDCPEETQPELITPVSQTAPAHSTNDPLMQSFPDLQTMDEAQLNLDLAEQYIELGAYESARVILQTNQSLFNQDQQQYVEKLLNKIAS